MAYGNADVTAVGGWTTSDYDQDDGSLDANVTACMTNGTLAESCEEIKEGTISLRVDVDVDPASLSSLSFRFYLNDSMSNGDNALLPYTDSNSVSTTNEVVQTYDNEGNWVEHICSAAFIAQLADQGGGSFAVRLSSSDGNAKSKLGEVELDYTQAQFTIDGITRDVDAAVLGSVEYTILKRSGLAPETWDSVANGTSNATTGAYSETVSSGTYRVVGVKDVAPQLQDITPPLTVGDAAASTDVFTLGSFSGYANNDKLYAYTMTGESLPGGISEDTLYYVVQQSGDTCKLSLTQGGSAINITSDGICWLAPEPATS